MESQSSVQSLDRAFGLLEILSHYPQGAALMEVVAQSGLHKSTAYRLLAALGDLGYVRKAEDGRYRLSLKLFGLAGRVVDDMDIVSAAKPFLDKLSQDTGEAVHLVVPDGTDIVYVRKVEGGQSAIRMFSRIGMRRAMYCTGVGKSLMARMSDAQVAEIWAGSDIQAYTAHTIVTLPDLLRELGEIRSCGYAIDNEENELGVRCVAAAVADRNGQGVGAISVSAPLARMSDERVAQLAQLVCQTARGLSAELGGIY